MGLLYANYFSEPSGPVNMCPTRVEDDLLEGIPQLLQQPEEQEAVEHKHISQGFHWLHSQALRRHLNAQIYATLKCSRGSGGGGRSLHGFCGAYSAVGMADPEVQR